jgi:hypothetical protein
MNDLNNISLNNQNNIELENNSINHNDASISINNDNSNNLQGDVINYDLLSRVMNEVSNVVQQNINTPEEQNQFRLFNPNREYVASEEVLNQNGLNEALRRDLYQLWLEDIGINALSIQQAENEYHRRLVQDSLPDTDDESEINWTDSEN